MLETCHFLSLNIEARLHLPEVWQLLVQENPDVFFLQEVFASDAAEFAQKLGYNHIFWAQSQVTQTIFRHHRGLGIEQEFLPPAGEWGVATYWKGEGECAIYPYGLASENNPRTPPIYDNAFPNGSRRAVLELLIPYSGGIWRFLNTHFTWTPKGEPNQEQRADVEQLLKIIHQDEHVILAGDLNAPRGGEIFSRIKENLIDRIPASVTSTMDPNGHYSGNVLELVVDGLLTSPHYTAENVRILDGVSDHCAIVSDLKPSLSHA